MKMKRFAAALLALILCAAFMTACSPKPEQPAATSGNASSGSAAAEPAATAEPTSAPTPVPPETTAMPEKTDTSVTVTPEKNGLYDALCDLFHGSAHRCHDHGLLAHERHGRRVQRRSRL
ncbi:MAG: hypothetical protein BHW31_04595 [Firmicutes bacterium CAG:110_56_8]|nr:MAG: hypothetical protein BHW31_04595 [Firmicutes bacterium CAG:110_56_8]